MAFAEAVLDPATRPKVIAAALPGLVGATTLARRPEVVEQVTRLVEATDPATLAWCQRAIAARSDSFAVLRETNVPAVVIAGAEDALVPVEEAAPALARSTARPLIVAPAPLMPAALTSKKACVSLITALPCGRRRASLPMACGSIRVSTLPGSEVPPRPER